MKKFGILGLVLLAHLAFAQDITSDLVGYWPFNGNANDESVNSNHGQLEGNASYNGHPDRFGDPNSSSLNVFIDNTTGDGGRLVIPSSSLLTSTTEVTVSLFFYSNSTATSSQGLILKSSPNNTPDKVFNVGYRNTSTWGVYGDIGHSTDRAKTLNLLSQNTWHHVAMTYKATPSTGGGEVIIYLDGGANQPGGAEYVFTESTSALDLSAGEIFIGSFGTENDIAAPFSGFIDDVSVYSRALTSQDIEALALGNIPPAVNAVCDGLNCVEGDIGIGTSTPDAKLHVVGGTKLDGNTTVTADLTSEGNLSIAEGKW